MKKEYYCDDCAHQKTKKLDNGNYGCKLWLKRECVRKEKFGPKKESKYKPYEVGKFYRDKVRCCGTDGKLICLGYTHQCEAVGGCKAVIDRCTCRGTGNVIMQKEDGTVHVGCLYNSGNKNPIPYGRMLHEWVDEPQYNWDELFTNVINKWTEIYRELSVAKKIIHVKKHVFEVESINGVTHNINIGEDNCAFCNKFNYSPDYLPKDSCKNCPICIDTGHKGCAGTPWSQISSCLRTSSIDTTLTHVDQFLAYLRNLYTVKYKN